MADNYVLDSDGCGTHCDDCGHPVCQCGRIARSQLFVQHYVLDSDGCGSTCATCGKAWTVCSCPHAADTRRGLLEELASTGT